MTTKEQHMTDDGTTPAGKRGGKVRGALRKMLKLLLVTVLVAGCSGAREERARRQQRQREMLAMSSRSRQLLAERSGHQIQKDQPELVIEAVGELIEEIRSAG